MNKTVTINIAGLFFHIDEDAYEKLSNYLNAIKNSLNTEGKEEIINDIESRIAEILSEKVDSQSGVVSMIEVDNVIQIMGQPEDYRLDDENSNENNSKNYHTNENFEPRQKKLFRDGEKGILGGVAAGLANYFNIDVVWIRIFFIVLTIFYGMNIIIYPILWIIIPKAKSVSDILEMKGEPVNISNIEKQVKENISQLGENFKNIDTRKFKQAGTTIGEIIVKIIGIACLFFGTIMMIGSFIMVFALNIVPNSFGSDFPLNESIEIGYPLWAAIASLFAIVFIPALILILTGLKCFYKNIKYIGLISILLAFIWAIAIVFFSIIMIDIDTNKDALKKFINETTKVTVVKKSLDHISNDTLNIEFVRDPRFYGINDTLANNKTYIEEDEVELEVVSTTSANAYYEIVTEASYSKNASIMINNSQSNFTYRETPNILEFYSKTNGNTIEFANAIISQKNNSNDFDNSVKILLYLPNNKTVRINNTDNSLFDYQNQIEKGLHFYKFIDNNLTCLSCN